MTVTTRTASIFFVKPLRDRVSPSGTAFLRTTNLIIAGKLVVVFGYGWCGKGVLCAQRGSAPGRSHETIRPRVVAVMVGYEVMLWQGRGAGQYFSDVTGCPT
jgi:adenosylhomocysteinase